jgi:hypothetical protein
VLRLDQPRFGNRTGIPLRLLGLSETRVTAATVLTITATPIPLGHFTDASTHFAAGDEYFTLADSSTADLLHSLAAVMDGVKASQVVVKLPPNDSANGHSENYPVRRGRCLPTRFLCIFALAASILLLTHTSSQYSHPWSNGTKSLLQAYHPISPLIDIPRELPSRHTLPSGDEIPSIAFGTTVS